MLTSYARWWRTTGRSAATLQNYLYALRRLATRLGGERQLLTASRADLESFLDDRLGEVSAATVSVEYRALRSFFGWLHEEGEVAVNPAARLRGPKVAETPVAVAAETDYRRLLAACPKITAIGRRDAAIIGLLWWGGLRRGEVAVLDLEHLDLDAGQLTIPRTKGGTPRRVPLHPELQSLFDRWLRRRGLAPGPLFPSERGRRLTSNGIGEMLDRKRAETGVTVSAHAFRRGLATRWMDAGGSETGLRSVAGWRSAAMVARYTRMNAEQLAHGEFKRLFG